MRGAREYAALSRAFETIAPACTDDDRFTSDELTEEDAAQMRRVCRQCPLLQWCDAFRRAGLPEAGFWAGQLCTPPVKRGKG